MNIERIIKEYEEKFEEMISIPIFNMPEGKDIDDFAEELQRCIDDNERFNEEKFGIVNDKDKIY